VRSSCCSPMQRHIALQDTGRLCKVHMKQRRTCMPQMSDHSSGTTSTVRPRLTDALVALIACKKASVSTLSLGAEPAPAAGCIESCRSWLAWASHVLSCI
jgi:hypothetical protein